MSTPSGVLVVGASTAGLATAEALRRKGYRGTLTLVGDEVHPPYDRPPLSKQVLAGTWTPERAHLRTAEALEVLDARCRAADGIHAVGDVARRHHDRLGLPPRLENRANATGQAMVVADNILGAQRSYEPVPYSWTDQFDARIHVHGTPAVDATATVVDGDLVARRFVVLHERDGVPVGVLGWNMPKQARRHHLAPSAPLPEGRR